ncbi:MAG: dCTP deaminase [Candidatus Hermodarchaeia archaeon]|jgi:dCTP deaminase
MCVLSKQEILKRVENGEISIEPFDPKMVGAASVDFTLGNKFRVFKPGSEPITVVENPDFETITEVVDVKDSYTLKPGELIHGMTAEKIRLPKNICGRIEGRSSLARIGLMVHITAGLIHPTSKGNQVLEITNMSDRDIVLKPGTRICQIVLQRMVGEAEFEGRFSDQNSP